MKPVLVLVGIQNDYFPGGKMELANMEIASTNARSLLDMFRYQGLSVFHVQHTCLQHSAGYFLPGTSGVEIHESVGPLPSEPVIKKNFPNSFRQTELLQQLRSLKASDLIICGAMSHVCIDATTRAASDHEFKCTVVQDACAACDINFRDRTVSAEVVHSVAMSSLAFAYAKVVDIGQLI